MSLYDQLHFHMLFLDGVSIDSADRSRLLFRWVKAPTNNELTHLTHTIAHRVARYLKRPSLTRNGQVRYELKTGRRNTNDWKKLSYFFMLKLSNILLPGKLSGVRK